MKCLCDSSTWPCLWFVYCRCSKMSNSSLLHDIRYVYMQTALQNILQHVVRFFHPRSSCTTHISADVFGGRKSLVKPVTRQKTCNYIDAYVGGLSENNIKWVMHDDLWWKNRTTRHILPRHWLYEWFSQFHRCGTYSVLSRSPSVAQRCGLHVVLTRVCLCMVCRRQ